MADNSTLPATGDVIASDDVGGVKYQRVKPSFGVDGAAVDVSATDPLPAYLTGQTVTGTLTGTGSVTISDLKGAATVTVEGVATAMTTHTFLMEVLTATGLWEVARYAFTAGTSGSITVPATTSSGSALLSTNSVR